VKNVLLLLLLFSFGITQGQSMRANIWLFGDSAGLDFSTLPPTPILNSKYSSLEGSATLCNKEGRLLYFMNYSGIRDSFGNLLKNGHLIGSAKSTTQPGILLESSEKKYFVRNIVSQIAPIGNGLDIFEGVGYDSFDLKFHNVFHISTEKVSAVNSVNRKSIYIVGIQSKTNDIYVTYADSNGIIGCPKTYFNNMDNSNFAGQLKFDCQGKLLANANWGTRPRHIEFYSFNNQTGSLRRKYFVKIPWRGSQTDFDSPYGLEFSPSGNLLYVSTNDNRLYQIDVSGDSLKAANSILEIEGVLTASTSIKYGQLQLGRDGKIYIAQNDSLYLSSIDSPDTKGTGCAFKENSIYLGGHKSLYGLPNFNQSYFYNPSIDFSYDLDCRSNTIHFKGKDTFGAISFNYQITDTSTKQLISNIMGKEDTSFVFANTGIYEVRFIASNGGKSDTVSKIIQVLPIIPSGYLGADTTLCLPDTGLALFAPKGLHCYSWNTGSDSDTIQVNQADTYFCHATDDNFCTVTDTIIVVQDTPKYSLKLQRMHDTIICINPPSGDGFKYHWYKNGGGLITLLKPKLTITDTGNYYLIVTQNGLCPQYSDTIHIDTIYGPSNVVQIPIQGLEIYPNPVNDYLKVDWKGTSDMHILFINTTGKTVLKQTILAKSKPVIDLSKLAKGVYILKVNDQFGGKLIIQ